VLIHAIKVYTELVKSGVFVEVNLWDEYISSFVNGSVAGTINGIWIAGSIQTAKDQAGKWGRHRPAEARRRAQRHELLGQRRFVLGDQLHRRRDARRRLPGIHLRGIDRLLRHDPAEGNAVANWIPAGKSSVYAEPSAFFSGRPVFQKVVEFGARCPAATPASTSSKVVTRSARR
jgi:lactose/L-arabinose transport system substrate-binding protein